MQSCSDDDKTIKYSELPEAAQTFVSLYFPTETVVHTERNKDNGITTYDVRLNTGTEIEFDSSGVWLDVDCKYRALPDGIMPTAISTYISTNYSSSTAYEIEKGYTGYKVSLTSGVQLYFTSDGTFVSSGFDY